MRFSIMIRRLITAITLVTIVGLAGCARSPEPGASSYHYTFKENNDTPHALAATLFEALRTEDKALWMEYSVTVEELTAQRGNSRRSSSGEAVQEEVDLIRTNFADLRDELRYEQGVHGAERIHFLRAFTQAYSAGDSTQHRTAVQYTYQGHYIGAILFRKMIRTDRGWVLAERSRYRDDVQTLVPLGIMRR